MPNMPKPQDTNCNDIIKMKIYINGHTFYVTEIMINTQAEFTKLQDDLKTIINNLKLEQMSRFGNPVK